MPNRLINEQSPYLLQHAHNPVNWYPWGDEAFQKAASENKPLIVSIGYAACHWCHVMERESFEDEGTASFMNEHFVCVKVDREEHPDVDALYMDAVQAISGSGGWPLNAFVTPERIPFYGGTYYPPRPAFNRPSWLQILQRMNEIWTNQKEEVTAQSEQMIGYLRQVSKAAVGEASDVLVEDCKAMATALLKMADKEWGGFGGAPKFPGTMAITFLLEHYRYFGNEAALNQALLSLDKMIAGGIYDHLGGGFSRYSTDREWLAPHFEKMLYDNALLLAALSDAYTLTGQRRYREVVEETIAFINRELRDESGGFYSALDADSEGVEGKFYTWTWQEWQAHTNGGNAFLEAYFGIIENGNWEHTNILHEEIPVEQAARQANISGEEAGGRLQEAKQHLFSKRATRIRPATDDKSLLSWNALMNIALTKAGIALGDKTLLEQARQHMEWMDLSFRDAKDSLMHVWKNGQPRIIAKLDDYAYLAQAMISFGIAAGAHQWVLKAAVLTEEMLRLFGEETSPFLYLSPSMQNDIPVRKTDVYDGATPSANAVAAQVLQALGMLMERSDWRARADEMLGKMLGTATRYTYSFGHWATLLQRSLAGPKTVVTTGMEAALFHAQMVGTVPPHVLVLQAENAAEKLPLTADKKSDGDSLIFVCTGTACLPPVSRPEDALRLL